MWIWTSWQQQQKVTQVCAAQMRCLPTAGSLHKVLEHSHPRMRNALLGVPELVKAAEMYAMLEALSVN